MRIPESWKPQLSPLTVSAWIGPALIAGAAVMFRPSIVPDGDPYWHVAVGRWIFEHWAIPHADPFSYTAEGPWSALEWGSQIVMSWAYEHAGMAGLQALFGIAAALSGVLLSGFLLRFLSAGPTIIFQVLTLGTVVEAAQARPQFLVLPVLILWTAHLLVARQEQRPPSWGLLPLMVLWANMHGSFILGVVLMAFFVAEALLDMSNRQVAERWVTIFAGTCLAALVTPWGIAGPVSAYNLTSMASNVYLSEWQSSTFDIWKTFEVYLLAALLICLTCGVRVPIVRLVLLLVLLFQTLHHQRYTVIFVVLGTLLLAEPIGKAIIPNRPRKPVGQPVALIGAIAVFSLALLRLSTPKPMVDTALTPVSAFAQVPHDLASRPVFNQFELGGFLILNEVRPFIDGRADVYGSEFVTNYFESIADRDRLQRTLENYEVVWAISASGHPVNQIFDTLPGWTTLYRDRFAVVHAKN